MSYRQEKNRSPPPSSYSHRAMIASDKNHKRRIVQITSNTDRAELNRHYTFLPDAQRNDTWQSRVVQQYHSHLYKEYVLADLTRPGQVGLRWRTRSEVKVGKGHTTCGNKHCPSYKSTSKSSSTVTDLTLKKYYESSTPTVESEEKTLLETLPHGIGLFAFEVPFRYVEHDESKVELVKLTLCLRCAPLLYRTNGTVEPSLKARTAREQSDNDTGNNFTKRTTTGYKETESTLSSSECDTSDNSKDQSRNKKKAKLRNK